MIDAQKLGELILSIDKEENLCKFWLLLPNVDGRIDDELLEGLYVKVMSCKDRQAANVILRVIAHAESNSLMPYLEKIIFNRPKYANMCLRMIYNHHGNVDMSELAGHLLFDTPQKGSIHSADDLVRCLNDVDVEMLSGALLYTAIHNKVGNAYIGLVSIKDGYRLWAATGALLSTENAKENYTYMCECLSTYGDLGAFAAQAIERLVIYMIEDTNARADKMYSVFMSAEYLTGNTIELLVGALNVEDLVSSVKGLIMTVIVKHSPDSLELENVSDEDLVNYASFMSNASKLPSQYQYINDRLKKILDGPSSSRKNRCLMFYACPGQVLQPDIVSTIVSHFRGSNDNLQHAARALLNADDKEMVVKLYMSTLLSREGAEYFMIEYLCSPEFVEQRPFILNEMSKIISSQWFVHQPRSVAKLLMTCCPGEQKEFFAAFTCVSIMEELKFPNLSDDRKLFLVSLLAQLDSDKVMELPRELDRYVAMGIADVKGIGETLTRFIINDFYYRDTLGEGERYCTLLGLYDSTEKDMVSKFSEVRLAVDEVGSTTWRTSVKALSPERLVEYMIQNRESLSDEELSLMAVYSTKG